MKKRKQQQQHCICKRLIIELNQSLELSRVISIYNENRSYSHCWSVYIIDHQDLVVVYAVLILIHTHGNKSPNYSAVHRTQGSTMASRAWSKLVS